MIFDRYYICIVSSDHEALLNVDPQFKFWLNDNYCGGGGVDRDDILMITYCLFLVIKLNIFSFSLPLQQMGTGVQDYYLIHSFYPPIRWEISVI